MYAIPQTYTRGGIRSDRFSTVVFKIFKVRQVYCPLIEKTQVTRHNQCPLITRMQTFESNFCNLGMKYGIIDFEISMGNPSNMIDSSAEILIHGLT